MGAAGFKGLISRWGRGSLDKHGYFFHFVSGAKKSEDITAGTDGKGGVEGFLFS